MRVRHDASRSFVHLRFAHPVHIADQTAVWMGEQAVVKVKCTRPYSTVLGDLGRFHRDLKSPNLLLVDTPDSARVIQAGARHSTR